MVYTHVPARMALPEDSFPHETVILSADSSFGTPGIKSLALIIRFLLCFLRGQQVSGGVSLWRTTVTEQLRDAPRGALA